jgi:ABC-type uncharacterized transport system YnjBCD permease subunit
VKHLRENNETYLSHLKFAITIGLSLMLRAVAFVLHGILPMVPVPKRLNLEASMNKFISWNTHAESRKNTGDE